VARGELRATGWALGPDGPLKAGLLLVDGRWAESVRTGMPRPDIAAASPGVPGSGWAGWEATVDLRRAAGPTALISLLAPATGGDWTELDRVEVRIDQSRALGGRRRGAAFTIVQNEADFLPLWLDYYGRHFEAADIYVLDHDSTDGSTAELDGRCNVVALHRDRSFDHVWLKSAVEAFQTFLLRSYEAVLFAEADEFVVADPSRYEGLGAYVDALDGPAACCTGFNVVHYPADEPEALDLGRPVLGQRRYWHRSPGFSKRLLSKVPLAWTVGFHLEANVPEVLPDPSLYLVHLHRADYELCLARHRAAAEREWNAADIREGLGRENRIVDEEEFARWFHHGDDLQGAPREEIPEHLQEVL
jgi:hypothetical protein